MCAFYMGDGMNKYMELAFKEAEKSLKYDDVPVGAVIVECGKIIAKAHNTKEKKQIVINHAEINAIKKACKKKKNWYLNNCELYVTLEPCKMCMGAIEQAHIKTVIYATSRNEKNASSTVKLIKGEGSEKSQKMLKTFFENKRK